MGHDYEGSKKIVLKTIIILGTITLVEVLIALLGKGYIIKGFHISSVTLNLFFIKFAFNIMGLTMIILSATKAYFIVYEFMHMKYEVPSLVKSVLLPTLLLVWGIIAFLYEGSEWGDRRELIENKNKEVRSISKSPTGMIYEIGTSDLR